MLPLLFFIVGGLVNGVHFRVDRAPYVAQIPDFAAEVQRLVSDRAPTLKKRLFSSPAAFLATLERHEESMEDA